MSIATAAAGCTSARSQQPSTISYVAFGDSFAAWETLSGYGYTKSFKDDLASERGAIVHETNLAHAGDSSVDLLRVLGEPTAQSLLRTADIVTWNIGTNDFGDARSAYRDGTCGGVDGQNCLRRAVATFTAAWDAIVLVLQSTPHKSSVVFKTMDVFYPDSASADPSFAVTNAYLEQMNAHIRSTASFAPVAAVRALFNGPDGTGDPRAARPAAPNGLLLPDGHPNREGASAIGLALLDGVRAGGRG
jgi:lysophospholipase L1-like esterase